MNTSTSQSLLSNKHIDYILQLEKKQGTLEYVFSEHMKMGALYWGLTSLHMLHHPFSKEKIQDTYEYVLSCRHPNGSFSFHKNHDGHVTSTHYAILILMVCERFEDVDWSSTINWIASLQNSDGSFKGDDSGEADPRFVFNALSSLALLEAMSKVDLEKTTEYIMSCYNHVDGGFSTMPGTESHAAYAFCCVGSLFLLNRLHLVNQERLAFWLSQRQIETGGFNGRPEKAADVCYSWWILSSLFVLEGAEYIDQQKLRDFIFYSQDGEDGGIGDRPGNMPDVFHTFFGLAALSLMGESSLLKIHPVYAIPCTTLKRYGVV